MFIPFWLIALFVTGIMITLIYICVKLSFITKQVQWVDHAVQTIYKWSGGLDRELSDEDSTDA